MMSREIERLIKFFDEDQPRDDHGRWTGGKDATVEARRIEPLHEVRDDAKFQSLVRDMRDNGWQGRPILVAEAGYGNEALTGSHRVAAAREAGVDVPIVRVSEEALQYSDEDGFTIENVKGGDEERLKNFLSEAGDHRAAELVQHEINENERELRGLHPRRHR